MRQQAQRLRVLSCTLMCNLLLVGEWLATAFQNVAGGLCVSKLNAYGC
ncbi:hypothetical protein PPRY_a4289 [Pseudoalteromonas prydzensis ACAM 620]|nr:hypothetical protein [Pseudoalteromonas prydzensis ACAM 620]MBE0376666.1 hypothetical protein [Pseudoalteromonas prydzensis ACAM 620]